MRSDEVRFAKGLDHTNQANKTERRCAGVNVGVCAVGSGWFLCIQRMHREATPEGWLFQLIINNLISIQGVHIRCTHFPDKVYTFFNDKCNLCTP